MGRKNKVHSLLWVCPRKKCREREGQLLRRGSKFWEGREGIVSPIRVETGGDESRGKENLFCSRSKRSKFGKCRGGEEAGESFARQ